MAGLPNLFSQPYQITNANFEVWNNDSISLPVGWNSYSNANCYLSTPYAGLICRIITSSCVHDKTAGSYPSGTGSHHLTLRTENISGGGINMAVSGLMSNGLFNIGSVSVYTPQNFFSTERADSRFRQPLAATPDSMYLWVKYYAVDDDSSRARIVAYLHGDTDFQYMNHIRNKSLYTAYINHLVQRTDTVYPATHWTQLKLPFHYDGLAAPKYLLIYLASDSCIMGGHIGNTLSIDNIQLVYSSWLSEICVDSIPIPQFKKDSFAYRFVFPKETPSNHVPQIHVKGEVNDISDSVVFIPSSKGLNGGRSVVTAIGEDRLSRHTYIIDYEVEKSDNTALSAIYCDSNALSQFHPDTLNYQVVLPAGTHLPPLVTVTPQWEGSTSQISQAVTLPGDAMIVVTSEDGLHQRTYRIRFSVALSTDATALWIKYNQLPLPGFHKDTLHYAVELPYGTAAVQLSAAPTWQTATIRYHQVTAFPATASVTVIAEDSSYRRTYSVDFRVAKNNDATLDSLGFRLSGTTQFLTNFDKKRLFYDVELPEKTRILPQLQAKAADRNATVQLHDATRWGDTATVCVVAENGVDSLCYRLFFHVKLSQDCRLDSLWINGMPFTGFSDSVYYYQVLLDSVYIPQIQATTKDRDARLTITSPQQIPGSASLVVTAEDTACRQTYWIHFSLPHSNSADLMALGYRLGNQYTPISRFHKDTLSYRVTLPALTTTVPVVEYTRTDFYASDTAVQPRHTHDSASVTVVSEDRTRTKTYRIYFDVALSGNADLTDIQCDGKSIPGFHKDTLHYLVELHHDSLRAPVVTAQAAVPVSQILILQAPGVNDTAWIRVRAEDSLTVKTYRVVFHRQLSPVASLESFHYTLGSADSLFSLTAGEQAYTISLKEQCTEVPANFRFNLSDSRARVMLSHIPAQTNDTLAIQVVSERGTDTTDYAFAFYRTPSSDTGLDTVWIDRVLLTSFSGQTDYECAVSSRLTEIPSIRAKATWEGSAVQITPPATPFGNMQIRVVAEDGIHYRIYNIRLRPQRREARLRAVFLNPRELLPYFSPDSMHYVTTWDFNKELRLSARTMDSAATYAILPLNSLCAIDYYEIRVWAEDRDDSLSYYLEIRWKDDVTSLEQPEIRSYPNPVQSRWTIEVPESLLPLQLQLFSTDGRNVGQWRITQPQTTLPVRHLPNGIYFYRLQKGSQILGKGKLNRQ